MKSVFIWKSLKAPPLFIPQADSYWPSTWASLMRKFLNITGCLTHILALNQPACSHLDHQGLTAATRSRERWHILMSSLSFALLTLSKLAGISNRLRLAATENSWTRKLLLLNHVMVFCQNLPSAIPSGNPTVTTNVPMDGNDPRGCRDWQWTEWDQELKVSEESRGLSKE